MRVKSFWHSSSYESKEYLGLLWESLRLYIWACLSRDFRKIMEFFSVNKDTVQRENDKIDSENIGVLKNKGYEFPRIHIIGEG